METLMAASSAALSEESLTTCTINDFLDDVTTAQVELEPVLADLYELGRSLEQHRGELDVQGFDAHGHERLGPSLTWAIRSSADVCSQIRSVLTRAEGCHQRREQWALTDASVQVEELRKLLQPLRRTVEVVYGALGDVESNSRLLENVSEIRQSVVPSNSNVDALLARCLDKVEQYIDKERACSFLAEPSPPSTPSVQEMIKALRDTSLDTMLPPRTQPVARPPASPHARSAPQAPTLQTIQDEDYFLEKRNIKRHTLGPPRSPVSPRNSMFEHLPPPMYTLMPPISPPPTKALPPIPPAKSPRRANRLSTASSTAPEIPKKSRARAFSDVTQDSKFSSVSSAATRDSVTSQCSSSCAKMPIPPHTSSFHNQSPLLVSSPDAFVSEDVYDNHAIDIVPIQRLHFADKDGSDAPVYALETSPNSTILASRHDKFHVRIADSSTGECLATIKVPFYVQMQVRSREFFIRSHHVLSETLGLVAIATNFGQTIEVWNWVKNKKVQTINDAYRWAAVRDSVFESRCFPLATYRSDDDMINLYPISDAHSKSKKKNPPFFGKPRAIELRKAGLPHIPKLPELAYSATAPLLVAAAGPRPPRPGNPPPEHAALLMAWQLDDSVNGIGGGGRQQQPEQGQGHAPYKFLHHRALENALPLSLATYGSVAVSIWEPARFRTFGRPGAWQVEPVAVTERVVLVWDFGSGEKADGSKETTSMYHIPDVLSCVSPDCRYVAYCDSGGRTAQQQSQQFSQPFEPGSGAGSLVVLDAMSGRELWRVDGTPATPGRTEGSIRNSAWSGRSAETKSSSGSSSKSTRNALLAAAVRAGSQGTEVLSLASSLDKVTDLAFSGDGTRLFVGYANGSVGVFGIREVQGIGMAV